MYMASFLASHSCTSNHFAAKIRIIISWKHTKDEHQGKISWSGK